MPYKFYRFPPATEMPRAVTLAWLFKHLPVTAWLVLAGSLITAFGLGVTLGRTTFVGEIFGKPPLSSEKSVPPKISSDNLNERVDQLVQGHNESTKSLYKSIAEEEQAAGKSPYVTDSGPHIESSKRLKETLKEENAAFQQQLKLLRELQR